MRFFEPADSGGRLALCGEVYIPGDEVGCGTVLENLAERLNAARKRFGELAESRTSDAALASQIVEQPMRWFVLGKKPGAQESRGGGLGSSAW